MIQNTTNSNNPQPAEPMDSQFSNKPSPPLPLNYDALIIMERNARSILEQVWKMRGVRMKIVECKPMTQEEYVSSKSL